MNKEKNGFEIEQRDRAAGNRGLSPVLVEKIKSWRMAFYVALLVGVYGIAPLSIAEEEQALYVYRFGGELECQQCRSYSLQLFPSGRVLFEGTVVYYELPPSASQTVERGTRETTVPMESMARWADMLTNEKFFLLLPKYRGDNCAMDGRRDHALTVIANGKTKTVTWAGCPESDAPLWLRQVANDIRKQVNPDQWLKVIPDPYRKKLEPKLKSGQSSN